MKNGFSQFLKLKIRHRYQTAIFKFREHTPHRAENLDTFNFSLLYFTTSYFSHFCLNINLRIFPGPGLTFVFPGSDFALPSPGLESWTLTSALDLKSPFIFHESLIYLHTSIYLSSHFLISVYWILKFCLIHHFVLFTQRLLLSVSIFIITYLNILSLFEVTSFLK